MYKIIFKKYIPLKLKVFVKNIPNYKILNDKYKIFKGKKKILVIGTPHHGNLGDQAIAYAELKIIKDNFPSYEVIEINISEYYVDIPYIKRYTTDEDIIILHGGGNLGNQYLYDENIRRDIIRIFKKNKIVLFPQTMYFTDDAKGRKELKNTVCIYSKHKDLTLVAREKISYEQMKKIMVNNNVLLTPDIVLYLNESNNDVIRDGALLCIRGDVESKLTKEQKEVLLDLLNKNYKKVDITDTLLIQNISKVEREKMLLDKWKQFKDAELVITDRIHGMIFAAITGTPCIALSNYNHKVKGTYEWIKHLKYIKFIDDLNEVQQSIENLKLIKQESYNNRFAIEQYNKIIRCIKRSKSCIWN